MLLASLPCVLGYNLWSDLRLIGGRDVLDSEDFIVSNILLPLGSLVIALFCCNRFGWGWDNFIAEANAGKGLKVQPWMKPLFRYFVPVVVVFLYIYGLVTFAWN